MNSSYTFVLNFSFLKLNSVCSILIDHVLLKSTAEYAYTLRVNEKSDIYSFGVVILELITGRPPIDSAYGEEDLVKWVSSTLNQKGIDQVIDPCLDSKYKEEISKVLSVGLLCTNCLPITRPSMRRVVKMLQEASADAKSRGGKKDGKLSPYYHEQPCDQGSTV